jgi:hypothetical protein
MDPLTAEDPPEIAGYRLGGRLGTGGMGRVYLAYTQGGRPVALKVLRPDLGDDPDFRQRFRQEIAAARRVHGLYTAQVLDANPDASPPWLVTAYVPGLSLQQAVARHGPMPPATVLLMMAGVAEALQAIHAVGVVHRDLKPSNVLLAPDGPRVIDFGIAWAAEAASLTRTGMRVGSPQFMAPEQVAGTGVSPAIDVFALGALAAFAATGSPPFGQGSLEAVLYRVVHSPADLTACPPPLRGLVERCLAKQPEARPTLAEVVRECRRYQAGYAQPMTQSWLPPAVTAELARDVLPAGPAGPAMPPGRGRSTPTVPVTARYQPPVYSAPVQDGPRWGRTAAIVGGAVAFFAAVGVAAALLAAPGHHLAAGHDPRGAAASQRTADGASSAPASRPAPSRSSSAPAAATGRWFAGTWSGTANQPNGEVTRWSVDLGLPKTRSIGWFALPTLHCSGLLILTGAGPTTASARQVITRNPLGLCVPGTVMLTKSSTTGMNLNWQDDANAGNTATGSLARG